MTLVESDNRPTTTAPVACIACQAPRVEPYVSGNNDPFRKVERPYTFYSCHICGLRFQVVQTGEARRLYADIQDPAPSREAPRKEIRADDDILRSLAKFTSGKRLLEVGSGDGWFLQTAVKRGYHCVGTDVSERLAEVARRRSGATVLVGDLAALKLPDASFDLVNLENVLMYVNEPRPLITEIARLLRPGGICRIRESLADSLTGRIAGKSYWMYAPSHCCVWTRRSLTALATHGGLRTRRVFHGSEASLTSWLASQRHPAFGNRIRDTIRFAGRKLNGAGLFLGADTSIYFIKPGK